MNYILAFSSALMLSLSLTPILIKMAYKFGYVAKPHKLRWHKNNTALLGGVGIFVAFVIPTLFFIKVDKTIIGLLVGSSIIFFVGFIDDILLIKPQLKLIGQIFAACVILAFGINFEIIPIRWIVLPLTIFWIVGITNAFNLLDNMDGLSSGIGVISCSFLFAYSLLNQMHAVALLSIILAGASLGFLRYNFYPAKIFMGDCGSQFLGMTIAIISIIGTVRHVSNLIVTLAIPVLILGVPIFDTTFVTFMRRLKGLPIGQGGKDHTSHRLVLLGLSERRTVLLLYLLSILFGLIALLYAKIDIIIVSILAILAVIILFFFGVFLSETKVYSDREMTSLKRDYSSKGKTVLNTFLLYKRRIAEVIIDLLLICISYYSAYLLRFEGRISPANFSLMMTSLPWLIIARLGFFYYFGLYQGMWRYIGIKDLLAIFKAVSASSISIVLFLTLFFRFYQHSRVVFILDWLLMLFLASAARILVRVLRESFVSLRPGEKKIIIFGAGDAGEMVLREIRYNKKLNYHPIGFLDDNPKKVGRKIHGVKVLGTRDKLTQLVKDKGIEEIIIAIPSVKQETLNDFFQQCKQCGVRYKRMTGILLE
jgi:UDP-GlcNAc:undecaprenyl-phosphate GlcNAc-1-phosphate transferase